MKHTLFISLLCCFLIQLPFGTAQLTVQGLLHVQGEALVHVEPDLNIETEDGVIENNGTIEAEGNITKASNASYVFTSTQGSRKLVLQGDSPLQRITGGFTGTQSFYELSLNKSVGMVELNSTIEVSQFFNLIQGKLRTDINSGTQASDYQYELYLTNPAPNALSGNFTVFSPRNFVEGRLRRTISGTGTYSFPVGLTESNPFSVTFNQPASQSDISASFESGTNTPIGMNFSCPNTPSTSVDCAIGRWNVIATADNYDYDIRFTPSPSLLQNCPNSTAFFVSKNGSFDCTLDNNVSDGIVSSQVGGFGVFDLPSALPMTSTACATPAPPTVSSNGKSSVAIHWDAVAGADGYLFQLRIKGMDRWLITHFSPSNRLFVFGPSQLEFEYRIKTVCGGGESEYTDVFDFNTRNEGNLSSASSRTNEVDIDISKFLSDVTLFPNPVVDQLQVSYAPIGEKATLMIHHINGQTVHQASLANNQSIHQVDVSQWEDGFYLLTIKEKGQPMVSRKIAKMTNR